MIGSAAGASSDSAEETTENNPPPSASQTTEQDTDSGSSSSPETVYTAYQVTELFDALQTNALKAESQFKGQYVEITGYLSVIDSGGKYISVGAAPDDYDYILQDVQCYIKRNSDQKSQIMEMTAGDPITVRGKITSVGEILGYSLEIDSIN